MEFVRAVNYYETDKMGIVHHSNYLRYFEEARIYLMDAFGVSYFETEKAGVMIPVLGVGIEYKQPLAFGDEAVIDTRVTHFDGLRMTISYNVYRKNDGVLTTTGESRHCFTDAKTFRPVNIKRKFPELYEEFLKLSENIK